MFRNAKVGDPVWSFWRGWGKCYEICNGMIYCIKVVFKDGFLETYTLQGKIRENENQDLFWDEIKFEIPKRKVKKWIPVMVFDKNRFVFGHTNNSVIVDDNRPIAIYDTKERALRHAPSTKYALEIEIEE